MKFTTRLTYTLLILILINSSSIAQSFVIQNVAQIEGDYLITFPEVRKYYYDHFYNKIYNDDKLEGYNKALDDLVNNQLKIIDFFELGFNKDEELLKKIKRALSEELVVQYFRTQFYEKYVNEKTTREAYDNMGKEIIYQQIVLSKPVNASNEYLDSLRAKAKIIKAKINNGIDFGELIGKYSENIGTEKTFKVNWEESLSNASNYIIYNLNVGDVQILEYDESINIVKVTGINRITVPPFDKMKDEILETLDKRFLDISLEEFDTEKTKLVDEASIEWNQKSLKRILEWSNTSGFYKQNYRDTLQNFISKGNNFVILKYSEGEVDLKEFLRLLDNVLIIENSGSLNEDDLKKFLLEAIRTDLIVKKAIELGLEKELLNSRTTSPVLRREIIGFYNSKMIEAQIPEVTKESLKQFYEENKDSLFYQFAKVNIYVLESSDSSIINEYKRKIEEGLPFEKVSGKFLIKTFIKDRQGKISSLSKEKSLLGEAAFKLQLSEIAGPMEYDDPENEKQFVIIKCVNKREEKQLLYEEVEKTIADEFVKYFRRKITNSTYEQLRKKYSVSINQDALNYNVSLTEVDGKF